MKSSLIKLAQAATLVIAITLTFTACEEKKKQDTPATTASETATVTETQQPSQEAAVAETQEASQEAAARAAAEAKAEAMAAEASCGKGGGGGVKLPECIITKWGVQKFEYDEQNRIVKIVGTYDTNTITYADNLVTVNTRKYVINGKTITEGGDALTIDKDGYIVNERERKYKYKNGNLIQIEYKNNDDTLFDKFDEYDNKKSPFSNSNTPKWLLYRLSLPFSTNNVLKSSDPYEMMPDADRMYNYEYEYDSDGFPIKKTEQWYFEDREEITITLYTYR